MATRAVTIRRRRRGNSRFFRRSSNSGGFKLPIAVIAGFAPLVYHVYDGARINGFSGAMRYLTMDTTGYDLDSKTWNFGDLVKGWTPILAGFVVHKMAGVFGVNRALGRAKIPLIRI